MNRIKKGLLFVLGGSLSIAVAQQPSIEPVLNDTIQIQTLEGNVEIKPVKVSDTLGMASYPDADVYDERFQELLYSHDGFDYMFERENELKDFDLTDVELSTDTLKARLKRMNQGTPFQIDYNPVLETLIKKKLKYSRVYLERIMTLSDYYFPMFEEQLDRFDVPLEMKYLAIVESALDPKIKSRVGATGLWQFMLPTGRIMGLEVDSYVDERMDPMKATIAACKYLNELYDIYEDWDLALAAYNSGAGNVNKAIRRSGGRKNYWNLRPYLPRETADYVPQFQAMMYLYTYASEHGFKPQRPSRLMMGTDTVLVKKKIHFDHIAQALDVDTEMIQYYNPSYKLDIIPLIEGKPHYLRLPTPQIASFVGNEEKIYAFAKAESDKIEKPDPKLLVPQTSITYKVRSGDYLGKIANRYKVNVSQLKRWNGLRSNNLRIGQRLKIMTRGSMAPTTSVSSTYKVKSGDSLWEIGKKHGVSVAQLKKLNPDKASVLKPGMTLNLK
ncbi:membrane-bound lytic murein transglycosylase D [Nonlabens sp. Hel1_33_55]|uniref:LysM peptidoglycan-binding domain-containing protein n=1 Tax=Nonlabens sp. Hel1_33_55 TaxID=1336802 RepID=UPI000875D3D4|nr:LysM peptidoglycan-binding domain-containing protein [Nonlabens sp. Hel1_33_55]SCY33194.1 membrane-bound lytic murein transglycosylase D [Nonlabens sp. Hel1_33_55]